jgi:hypothetical protein
MATRHIAVVRAGRLTSGSVTGTFVERFSYGIGGNKEDSLMHSLVHNREAEFDTRCRTNG